MKKTVLAGILLAALIALGIFEQVYLDRTFATFQQKLDLISENIEDPQKSKELIYELKDWWTDQNLLIEGFASHNETREIVSLMSELSGYILAEQVDEAKATVIRLKFAAEYTEHLLSFAPEHIF